MTDPRANLLSVIRATHEIFMTTSDRLEPVLAEHRLTYATATALWAIDPDAPPPPMKTLAELLHCNAPNLSFIANQLVDRGLAERSVDPADRRSRVLTLTETGRRVRGQVIDAAVAVTPFAGCTPEELAALAALLGPVAASS